MNAFTFAKISFAVVGVAVWGYGARIDDANVRLAGLILIAVAFVLRFLPASLRDRMGGGPPRPTDTHP